MARKSTSHFVKLRVNYDSEVTNRSERKYRQKNDCGNLHVEKRVQTIRFRNCCECSDCRVIKTEEHKKRLSKLLWCNIQSSK